MKHLQPWKDEDVPTFDEIRQWSWRRKKNPGTVYDAAKHFKVPAKIIADIVNDMKPYPYFYIVGDGPEAKEMYFEHDGD